MTHNTTKKMKVISDIQRIITDVGFIEDRYGNYVKTYDTHRGRFKFNPISLRVEKRSKETGSKWIRITSMYYKDLSVDENGTVRVKGKIFIRGE